MHDERLKKMEKDLTRALTGEMALSEVAIVATRDLGAALAEIRRLRLENSALRRQLFPRQVAKAA